MGWLRKAFKFVSDFFEYRKCKCVHVCGPVGKCKIVVTDANGNVVIDEATGKPTVVRGVYSRCVKCGKDLPRIE